MIVFNLNINVFLECLCKTTYTGYTYTRKKKKINHETSQEKKNEKKRRKQKYRPEWEKNPDYEKWLRPVRENQYKAKCIKCNTELVAELGCVKLHMKSKLHASAVKDTRSTSQSIMSSFTSGNNDTLQDAVQLAEIKLSAFLAEHNVAFRVIDHIEGVLKEIFPDSKICQKLKLKRTKATNIIKNVIAPSEKEVLITKLNRTQFSVMVDESTDIACESTICVVVRFYDHEHRKIVSRFWDLIQVIICICLHKHIKYIYIYEINQFIHY